MLPGARIVRAFASVPVRAFTDLLSDASGTAPRITVPLASDDRDAKALVGTFMRQIGVEPFDLGALAIAGLLGALVIFVTFPRVTIGGFRRAARKVPTAGLTIRSVNMDFLYGSSFLADVPEAYETLLLDAIRGDGTLFTRQDSVERAWEICDPLIQQWQTGQPQLYQSGSWGPDASDDLLARDGRRWRRP